MNNHQIAQIAGQVTANVMAQMGQPDQKKPMLTERQILAREQKLKSIFSNQSKLQRFAAKLDSPVRSRKDFVGLTRQLSVVELIPNGMPIFKDRDYPDIPAIKVGRNGNAILQEQISERIELEAFELKSKPKLPYTELYLRLFNTVVRLKDKVGQGLAIAEDDYFFALTRQAVSMSNQSTTLNTALTIRGLAFAMAQVERNRLKVKNIVLHSMGNKDIRSFEHDVIGPTLLQSIQHEGYIGSLWDANFFISDRVQEGEVLVYAEPDYVAWTPVRKDSVVVPVDDPDNTQFGLTGYELLAMTIHNINGVARITFDANA